MLRLRPCSATILLQTELSPYSSGNSTRRAPIPCLPPQQEDNDEHPGTTSPLPLRDSPKTWQQAWQVSVPTMIRSCRFQSDTGKPPQNANSVSKAGIDNGCLSSDNSNSSRAGKPTHHEFIPWFFPPPPVSTRRLHLELREARSTTSRHRSQNGKRDWPQQVRKQRGQTIRKKTEGKGKSCIARQDCHAGHSEGCSGRRLG